MNDFFRAVITTRGTNQVGDASSRTLSTMAVQDKCYAIAFSK